jgi:hypothetical protein
VSLANHSDIDEPFPRAGPVSCTSWVNGFRKFLITRDCVWSAIGLQFGGEDRME